MGMTYYNLNAEQQRKRQDSDDDFPRPATITKLKRPESFLKPTSNPKWASWNEKLEKFGMPGPGDMDDWSLTEDNSKTANSTSRLAVGHTAVTPSAGSSKASIPFSKSVPKQTSPISAPKTGALKLKPKSGKPPLTTAHSLDSEKLSGFRRVRVDTQESFDESLEKPEAGESQRSPSPPRVQTDTSPASMKAVDKRLNNDFRGVNRQESLSQSLIAALAAANDDPEPEKEPERTASVALSRKTSSRIARVSFESQMSDLSQGTIPLSPAPPSIGKKLSWKARDTDFDAATQGAATQALTLSDYAEVDVGSHIGFLRSARLLERVAHVEETIGNVVMQENESNLVAKMRRSQAQDRKERELVKKQKSNRFKALKKKNEAAMKHMRDDEDIIINNPRHTRYGQYSKAQVFDLARVFNELDEHEKGEILKKDLEDSAIMVQVAGHPEYANVAVLLEQVLGSRPDFKPVTILDFMEVVFPYAKYEERQRMRALIEISKFLGKSITHLANEEVAVQSLLLTDASTVPWPSEFKEAMKETMFVLIEIQGMQGLLDKTINGQYEFAAEKYFNYNLYHRKGNKDMRIWYDYKTQRWHIGQRINQVDETFARGVEQGVAHPCHVQKWETWDGEAWAIQPKASIRKVPRGSIEDYHCTIEFDRFLKLLQTFNISDSFLASVLPRAAFYRFSRLRLLYKIRYDLDSIFYRCQMEYHATVDLFSLIDILERNKLAELSLDKNPTLGWKVSVEKYAMSKGLKSHSELEASDTAFVLRFALGLEDRPKTVQTLYQTSHLKGNQATRGSIQDIDDRKLLASLVGTKGLLFVS
jgi:hypothetical protein